MERVACGKTSIKQNSARARVNEPVSLLASRCGKERYELERETEAARTHTHSTRMAIATRQDRSPWSEQPSRKNKKETRGERRYSFFWPKAAGLWGIEMQLPRDSLILLPTSLFFLFFLSLSLFLSRVFAISRAMLVGSCLSGPGFHLLLHCLWREKERESSVHLARL